MERTVPYDLVSMAIPVTVALVARVVGSVKSHRKYDGVFTVAYELYSLGRKIVKEQTPDAAVPIRGTSGWMERGREQG